MYMNIIYLSVFTVVSCQQSLKHVLYYSHFMCGMQCVVHTVSLLQPSTNRLLWVY